MEKKWIFQPSVDEEKGKLLSEQLKVNELVAQLLLQRSIDTEEAARSFFRPDLAHLHDPFQMKDMHRAVDRLLLAIEKEEGILLFGDYDVDGTTAVALMFEQLSPVHPNLNYYIPDRYKEGYGLSQAGIDFAKSENRTLIINRVNIFRMPSFWTPNVPIVLIRSKNFQAVELDSNSCKPSFIDLIFLLNNYLVAWIYSRLALVQTLSM